MRKSSYADRHQGKAIVFGLDQAPPPRPWRENRLICAPTETRVYLDGMGAPIRAEIHDVSRSGLRLDLAQPLVPGSTVKVELAGMIATGEIRYCIETRGKSFRAGMRIDSTQKLV